MRRASGRRGSSRPDSEASSAAAAPPTSKSVEELERQVAQLEELLEERKRVYSDLCAADGGDSEAEDSIDEARRLALRNAEVRQQLKALEALEKRYGNDPRVLDRRNLVTEQRRLIAAVDKEIDTLMAVKKRRDKGLREIDRNERKIRDVRERQNAVNSGLRAEAKALLEELRELERADLEVHDRYARMQGLLAAGATADDVDQLTREVEAQQEEIRELQQREAALKKQAAGAREDVHRALGRERRECGRLEDEVQRLRQLLERRELELKRSYQAGALGIPGGKAYIA